MSLSLLAMILSNGALDIADGARLELEARSAFWFGLVKDFGYAVGVGCAMEAPETFILMKRWWLLRFRDTEYVETKEDRKNWIVPLAALGLLFIVLGILAETYCEGRVSDVDALLRAHESDKITAAENEAASATRQAGTAASNAQIAKDSADKAEADLKKSDEHLAAILAWRTISPEKLAGFNRTLSDPKFWQEARTVWDDSRIGDCVVHLEYAKSCDECEAFAQNIKRTLDPIPRLKGEVLFPEESTYTTPQFTFAEVVEPTGVEVVAVPRFCPQAEPLAKMLGASFFGNNVNGNMITVRIWPKPHKDP